jgi:hypothetical protein
MTRKLIALVPWFALLLGMVAGPALAADAPVVGHTVTGRLALAGKTIPLPEGPWRIAASGHGSAKAANGTLFSVTAGVLLVRPDPADRAFLLVQTNALPARDGWGTSPSCEGTLFTQISESRDLHEGCTFVSFARGPHRVGTLLPALSAEAEGTLPPWALVAGFRVSDRRDMIDMRLGVSPSSPDPAAWAEGPAGLDTAHAATLYRLSDWAQTARRATLAAMRAAARARCQNAHAGPAVRRGWGRRARRGAYHADPELVSAGRLSRDEHRHRLGPGQLRHRQHGHRHLGADLEHDHAQRGVHGQ